MKKFKKVFIATLTIVALSILTTGLTSNSRLYADDDTEEDCPFEISAIIHIPNFGTEDWCRCKHGGCHQGYWISFRRKCGSNAADCYMTGSC